MEGELIRKASRVPEQDFFFFKGIEANACTSNTQRHARYPPHQHPNINLTKLPVPESDARREPGSADPPAGRPHPSLRPRPPPSGGQRRSLRTSRSILREGTRSILPGCPSTQGEPVEGGVRAPGSAEPEQGALTLTYKHWWRQPQPLTIMFPCILAV